MSPPDATKLLKAASVIPVLTIESPTDAVPLAKALVKGGLNILEVTLRTPAALEAIKAMRKAVPEAIIGAGTILSEADAEKALLADAQFMVSPGTPQIVAKTFAAMPVLCLPGCSTVSEAMQLAGYGFKVLKLFPAEAVGGVAFLKSIGGPLPKLMFCPTGGIDAQKAPAYLALSNVMAVGGSWMVPEKLIKAQDFAAIERLAAEAAALKR